MIKPIKNGARRALLSLTLAFTAVAGSAITSEAQAYNGYYNNYSYHQPQRNDSCTKQVVKGAVKGAILGAILGDKRKYAEKGAIAGTIYGKIRCEQKKNRNRGLNYQHGNYRPYINGNNRPDYRYLPRGCYKAYDQYGNAIIRRGRPVIVCP